MPMPPGGVMPPPGQPGGGGLPAFPTPPAAAGNEIPSNAPVEIKFNNTPVEQVLEFYATLVGRTILRHPTIQANTPINVRSQTGLTPEEARQALDTILSYNNITMVPIGEKFMAAVPAANVLQEGVPFRTADGKELPEAAQFITEVVRLTNAIPTEILPAIQPFSKMPAGIITIDSSQLIILRDYAINVKRMMEIIKRIDVSVESEYKLEVIPIRYGKVADMYSVMGGLIGGGGGGGAQATAGGARTTSRSTGRAGAGGRAGSGSSSRYGSQGRNTMSGQQTLPGQQPSATSAQSAFNQKISQIVSRAAAGGSEMLGDAKIIPDDRSNSLVVYANKQDMQVITNIVAKLDVMLAQVLIEAVIMDVNLSDNVSFGVSYLQHERTWTGNRSPQVSSIGGLNNGEGFFNGLTGALTNGTLTKSLATGLPSGFSYYTTVGDNLDVTVQAIAGNTKANVLQRPRVQTTHAVPATFTSGSQEPYSGGSGGSYGGYTGYYGGTYTEYLNVGITLNVTPYITPDGLVMMEIDQTIDELAGYVEIASGTQTLKAPRTTSRGATSTVAVKDGDTIILGGFIRTSKSTSNSGIPLLKDIPLLGALFRSNSRDTSRSELLILIRPKVLATPEQAAAEVAKEKARLPGVRSAENDFDKQEKGILKSTDKKLLKKP
jgi:general secretion pathway protein D